MSNSHDNDNLLLELVLMQHRRGKMVELDEVHDEKMVELEYQAHLHEEDYRLQEEGRFHQWGHLEVELILQVLEDAEEEHSVDEMEEMERMIWIEDDTEEPQQDH